MRFARMLSARRRRCHYASASLRIPAEGSAGDGCQGCLLHLPADRLANRQPDISSGPIGCCSSRAAMASSTRPFCTTAAHASCMSASVASSPSPSLSPAVVRSCSLGGVSACRLVEVSGRPRIGPPKGVAPPTTSEPAPQAPLDATTSYRAPHPCTRARASHGVELDRKDIAMAIS